MKTFRATIAGENPLSIKIENRRILPYIRTIDRDSGFTRQDPVPIDRDLSLSEALATCETVQDIEDTLASAGIVLGEHIPYMAVTAGFLCGFLFWLLMVLVGTFH